MLKFIRFTSHTNTKLKDFRCRESIYAPFCKILVILYFVDEDNFAGLMLTGTIELLQDRASRKMLWYDGCEVYYPLGIDDPDYTVLCFTSEWGNYYRHLKNTTFKIEDI